MSEPLRFDEPPFDDGSPPEGIYNFGMNEEFRKNLNFRKGLLSYSRLKRFANPGKKISKYVAGVGNLVSDTLLFGPDAVLGRYVFAPEQWKKNTKIGKIAFNAFQAEHPGMTIIRPNEREEAERLITQVGRSEDCVEALAAPGLGEAGIVADLDGVKFRSWIDKLTPKAVIDIKTTRDESPEMFLDSAIKYGYDLQASLYLDQAEAIGMGQLRFFWLVVSKTTSRAWIQELPPWAYHTGHRWRVDMTRAYLRETELRERIAAVELLNQTSDDAL